MVTAISRYLEKTKGVGTAKLIKANTGKVLHLPNFDFTLNPGKEVEQYEINAPDGSMIYAGKRIVSEKPSFELVFRQNAAEVIEMITGYEFEVATNQEKGFSREVTIGADGMVEAIPTGNLGSTVIQDDPNVSISVIGDFRLSKVLTRIPWANTPATADEFAVDAGGALKFHTDLAGETATVSIRSVLPQTLDMSETPIGLYHLRAVVVLTDSLETILVEADNNDVQFGAPFNPKATENTITLMPITPLGGCASYKLSYTGQKVSC